MKQLTQAELDRFQLGEAKLRIKMLELEVAKLKQQAIQQKAKNFELISSLKQYEVKDATDRLEGHRKQYTAFMEELKEKYEITSEQWGFDPETGEILED